MKYPCALIALITSQMLCAATPIDGLYSSVFGGYAYLPDNVNQTSQGVLLTDAVYQSSYDAGGSLGYKSNPMRYEGELSYITGNLKGFRVNGTPADDITGYSHAILGMANVFVDFPNLPTLIQPFVGLGLGYGWVNVRLDSQFQAKESAFAYQAAAGLTYNFSENYALNIGYRYVSTWSIDSLNRRFQAQIANVGAIYRFDENHYK